MTGENVSKVLEHLTDPADSGTFLLAGISAFVLESGLDLIPFLDQGHTGLVVGGLALAIRHLFKAGAEPRRAKILAQGNRDALRKRADALLVDGTIVPEAAARRLRSARTLHEAGAATDAQFERAVSEAIDAALGTDP